MTDQFQNNMPGDSLATRSQYMSQTTMKGKKSRDNDEKQCLSKIKILLLIIIIKVSDSLSLKIYHKRSKNPENST